MSYHFVSPIYLVIHAPTPPSQDEWSAYLQDMETVADQIRGIVVTSVGGSSGPNARQRQEAAELWEKHGGPPPIAVVTESAVQRGIVTAFNWFFSKPMRVFSPKQASAAFEYVHAPPQVCQDLRFEVLKFARELGIAIDDW